MEEFKGATCCVRIATTFQDHLMYHLAAQSLVFNFYFDTDILRITLGYVKQMFNVQPYQEIVMRMTEAW